MKLKSLSIAIVICTIMLASCGNSAKTSNVTETEGLITDTLSQVEADSCEADEASIDSIVTRGRTLSEGFGRCSKCNCKEFEGRGQTCRNCGHAYKDHY